MTGVEDFFFKNRYPVFEFAIYFQHTGRVRKISSTWPSFAVPLMDASCSSKTRRSDRTERSPICGRVIPSKFVWVVAVSSTNDPDLGRHSDLENSDELYNLLMYIICAIRGVLFLNLCVCYLTYCGSSRMLFFKLMIIFICELWQVREKKYIYSKHLLAF